MPAKGPQPNPIDKHIGGRVRIRRLEIDISQADPAARFFEGAPGGFEGYVAPDIFMKFFGTEDGQRLAVAFNRINHLGLRRRVVRLIETISKPPGKRSKRK